MTISAGSDVHTCQWDLFGFCRFQKFSGSKPKSKLCGHPYREAKSEPGPLPQAGLLHPGRIRSGRFDGKSSPPERECQYQNMLSHFAYTDKSIRNKFQCLHVHTNAAFCSLFKRYRLFFNTSFLLFSPSSFLKDIITSSPLLGTYLRNDLASIVERLAKAQSKLCTKRGCKWLERI